MPQSQRRALVPRTPLLWFGAPLLLCGAALLLVPGSLAAAPSDCATQLAGKVQSHYDGVRDLEARFAQTTRAISIGSALLSDANPTRGTVVFEKPGKMRWTYTEPAPSLVVSDGEVLWIVDVVAKEVQRLAVDQGYLSGAAMVFLMGDGVLTDEFRVSVPGDAKCDGDAPVALELQPIGDATYERMGLSVLPATGEIVATTIVDLFGNVTEVSFEGWRTNLDPAEATFRFEAPDGFSIIDLTPAR